MSKTVIISWTGYSTMGTSAGILANVLNTLERRSLNNIGVYKTTTDTCTLTPYIYNSDKTLVCTGTPVTTSVSGGIVKLSVNNFVLEKNQTYYVCVYTSSVSNLRSLYNNSFPQTYDNLVTLTGFGASVSNNVSSLAMGGNYALYMELEFNEIAMYLFKKDNNIYSIKSDFYGVFGQGTPTESDFLNKGADSLSVLSSDISIRSLPLSTETIDSGKLFSVSIDKTEWGSLKDFK